MPGSGERAGETTSREGGTAPWPDSYYWLVDLLQEQGAKVHLAHPSGLKWEGRRVKNDEIDATDLADRLRMHRLPEAWIAPPEARRTEGTRAL